MDTKVTFRLDEEIYKQLKHKAVENSDTVQAILRRLVQVYLKAKRSS